MSGCNPRAYKPWRLRDAAPIADQEIRTHTSSGSAAGARTKASAGRCVVSVTGYQLGGLQLVQPQVGVGVRHGDALVIWRDAHAAAIVLAFGMFDQRWLQRLLGL